MNTSVRATVVSVVFVLFAACSQATGEITRDTKPFDGIAQTASVSTLGMEPFWGIDIEPIKAGYVARYSSPEDLSGTTFAVDRFAGNNGVSFSGELNGEPALIALTPGECNDTMSERTYPYTVTVAIGARTLLGCGYTSDEPFTGDEAP